VIALVLVLVIGIVAFLVAFPPHQVVYLSRYPVNEIKVVNNKIVTSTSYTTFTHTTWYP